MIGSSEEEDTPLRLQTGKRRCLGSTVESKTALYIFESGACIKPLLQSFLASTFYQPSSSFSNTGHGFATDLILSGIDRLVSLLSGPSFRLKVALFLQLQLQF